jgi:DNA polymerase-3 subunit delta
MAALKANEVAAFVKAPRQGVTAVLIYGPDLGLVAERGRSLAETVAATSEPPGEIVRMDDADLEGGADQLTLELTQPPMFGGRRIVRATPGRRLNTNLLKSLLEGPPLAGYLIVETDNLRPDEALRKLFERVTSAIALPCYGDEARDLESLIREILARHRLTISDEARELLVARLGADRALSRGEIEKLTLYVHGRGRIEVADVEAIVGDAAEQTIDRVIGAVQAGDVARALRECDRAVAAGESPQGLLLMLQRHFQRLHRVRAGMDAGRSLDEITRGFRPPLHFRAKDSLAAGTRRWSSAALASALTAIGKAAVDARLGGDLEVVHLERLLLVLGRLGGAASAGPPVNRTRR